MFVIEVEEGAVVIALGGLGQLDLEKLVEGLGGRSVDGDVERVERVGHGAIGHRVGHGAKWQFHWV